MPVTARAKPTRLRTKRVEAQPNEESRPATHPWLYRSLVLVSFLIGLLISYAAWGQPAQAESLGGGAVASTASSSIDGDTTELAALHRQINPSEGYKLPASYGDLGPRLLKSGAIDYDAFAAIYQDAGSPLTAAETEVLTKGVEAPIVITAQNSHFLLNFFWAVGLVNKNKILTEGPMVQYGGGKIEGFASTGGWTLGTKPITDLYASVALIPLTPEQQARVEEVAAAVYRPCCDNPTLFPDCNHGMAMLGALELMASQNASLDQMFTAAKYINAFWFPDQTLETAIYLKANQGIDFVQAEPRLVTGEKFSSGSGSGAIHASLQAAGLLPQEPGKGGNCAN